MESREPHGDEESSRAESSGRMAAWIGIEVELVDGSTKRYLWYQNLRGYDLADEGTRLDVSWLLASIKVGLGVDATVGPALERERGSRQPDQAGIGLYIEAPRREGFGLLVSNGPTDGAELLRDHSAEFAAAYRAALAALPAPR